MGGFANWPDAGGVGDQSAWVVDAFTTLVGIEASLEEEAKSLAGKKG